MRHDVMDCAHEVTVRFLTKVIINTGPGVGKEKIEDFGTSHLSRQPNNPATVVGHDENHVVPDYEGPALDPDAMEVDNNPAAVVQPAGNIALGNHAEVHMVVIDGIVMGPRHCAMEG
ncbi:hypothetical protein BDN71DRAFT_1437353, partial [Pleurotus eryngii]